MNILSLLDYLESELGKNGSRGLGGKVSVDKDKCMQIMQQIRDNLPEDIMEARYVVEQRNQLIFDAQQQCDEMTASARQKCDEMNAATNRQCEEMTASTQQKCSQMLESAQGQLDAIINDETITRGAQAKAGQIIVDAENSAAQIRQAARNYADTVLASLQEYLKGEMDDVVMNRSGLHTGR